MTRIDMETHLTDQRLADARWLLSPEGGSLHRDLVAARLGLTRDHLDSILERPATGRRLPSNSHHRHQEPA